MKEEFDFESIKNKAIDQANKLSLAIHIGDSLLITLT